MPATTLRVRAVRRLTFAVLAASTVALGAAAVSFGGPWISIESPVNPYDAAATGALFVVHTFRHANPMDMGITGQAEGVVDGKRRSATFTLSKAHTGTYVVRRQWGDKGVWTLVVTATPSDHGPGEQLQAVVEIGADGQVGKVTVPRDDRGTLRAVAAAEIERSLRERAKLPVSVGAR